MKHTVLVTGAKGQLGSEIKKLAGNYQQLQFIFTDVDELDITNAFDIKAFLKSRKIDYIINCAAYTAVDKAESEIELAEKINILAVKNLTDIASELKIKFIHTSTDYVFDGKNYKPYKENDIPNPQSKYGITKLKGEEEALKYENSMIVRTSWLYTSFGNNFVKTMIKLGNEREELRVVCDQAGTPTYARDLARAILEITNNTSNNTLPFVPGIYHYSNEGICSWYDFAKEIMVLTNTSCNIIPIESKDYPTPARRPSYSVLNKDKIKTTYKIDIPYWKDSLIECLQVMNSQNTSK